MQRLALLADVGARGIIARLPAPLRAVFFHPPAR
jgi:hypothetical protein